ncbi:MAG: hypothetical protein BGO55_22965 [Sphingobacteriales bacterium 50-39]|nr:MAG: hypothetical protein BGO55_22965 [Sphingobacteriales bacterium 50-39]
MRHPICWFLLAFFAQISCRSSQKPSPDVPAPSHDAQNIKKYSVDSSLFTKKDSIVISFADRDTLTYSREEFNHIIVHFPMLYREFPSHPDEAYAAALEYPDTAYSFGSEVGQDNFYMLYAYFLSQKNKGPMLAGARDTLIRIFEAINHIYGQLNHGGTYFGHQYSRLIGNAEYEIYILSEEPGWFKKDYPIVAQKAKFIDLIRQQITDEVSVDNYLLGPGEKQKARQEMQKDLDKMNALITNYFYLTKARSFLYENYDVQ